jgi:hypothetical protein
VRLADEPKHVLDILTNMDLKKKIESKHENSSYTP